MKTYIREIEGKWYAFGGDIDKNQVYSIGKDNPPSFTGCSHYVARWTDYGIRYIANASPNKQAARKKAIRNGDFDPRISF